MLETIQVYIGPVSYVGLTIVASAVLLAGFIRGFVGFGAALIIVMVLSAVFGPIVAVPAANLSGLPATIQLLPTAVRDSERGFVLPFGLASFAIAPFGVMVLLSLDPSIMRMAISVFVLLMFLVLVCGWQLTRRPSKAMLTGAGASAGLIQGAASVSGPLAVILALSQPGSTVQQRANVIGAVTSLNLCAMFPFWYLGLFTRESLLLALMIAPLYSLAIWIGARFFGGKGRRHFRNAALLALAGIGIVTLYLAVRDYIAA
jgi:uncharacterized membrane protein YfcA